MFQIDANSGIPIYRQIVDQIRRLIHSGNLIEGDKMPSAREVALDNAVNPMTVSKAYALAGSESLLLRQRGRPMEVANQTHRPMPAAERLKELDPMMQQTIEAAKQLKLNVDQVRDHLNTLWNGDKLLGRKRPSLEQPELLSRFFFSINFN